MKSHEELAELRERAEEAQAVVRDAEAERWEALRAARARRDSRRRCMAYHLINADTQHARCAKKAVRGALVSHDRLAFMLYLCAEDWGNLEETK